MAKHTGTAADYHAFTYNRGRGLLLASVPPVGGGQEAVRQWGPKKTYRVGPVFIGRVRLPEPNNYFFYA